MKVIFFKEERPWWLVILIALILPRLTTFLIPIWSIDEALYAVMGQEILNGSLPYQDTMDHKPPLLFYYFALIFWIGGEGNMFLAHLVQLGVVALVCWTLFKIGTLLGDRKIGWWAALFYAIFSAAGIPSDFLAVNAEFLMVLPLSLAVLLLFSSDQKFSLWKDFLGGVSLGIAFLFKYQAGINLFLTLLYLGILCPILLAKDPTLFKAHKGRRMGHFVCRSILYMVGFSVPIIFLLFYFWSKGILAEFYFWGWAYNFSYINQGVSYLSWDYYFLKFLGRTSLIALGGFLVWFLGIKQGFHTLRSFAKSLKGHGPHDSLLLLFCVLWFLISFIPVSMGGRFFWHYFIQLIPPLCLLAAMQANKFWNHKRYRPVLIFFSLLPLLIFMPKSTSKIWEKKKNFEIVGEYVRKNSNPEDRIFIWGFWPRAYYFSKRRPASRFLYCDFLTGSTSMTDGMNYDPINPQEGPSVFKRVLMDLDGEPGPLRDYDTSQYIVPKAWPLFFLDLEKNKPLFFIDTSTANILRFGKYPLKEFPQLMTYIERNYQWVKKIEGVDVYRRTTNG